MFPAWRATLDARAWPGATACCRAGALVRLCVVASRDLPVGSEDLAAVLIGIGLSFP
jgi:hypothetical protein